MVCQTARSQKVIRRKSAISLRRACNPQTHTNVCKSVLDLCWVIRLPSRTCLRTSSIVGWICLDWGLERSKRLLTSRIFCNDFMQRFMVLCAPQVGYFEIGLKMFQASCKLRSLLLILFLGTCRARRTGPFSPLPSTAFSPRFKGSGDAGFNAHGHLSLGNV